MSRSPATPRGGAAWRAPTSTRSRHGSPRGGGEQRHDGRQRLAACAAGEHAGLAWDYDGSASARAKGRTGGRPTVMNADTLAAAQARHAKGESPTQIAKALGISRATVYRHLAG